MCVRLHFVQVGMLSNVCALLPASALHACMCVRVPVLIALLNTVPRVSWGHLTDGECLVTKLQLCLEHPDARVRAAVMQSFLFVMNANACMLIVAEPTAATAAIRCTAC